MMLNVLRLITYSTLLLGIAAAGLLLGSSTTRPVEAQNAPIQNNNNAMGLINFIDTFRYHNFGTTQGSNGFGIREGIAGVMEVKSDGGDWAAIGAAGIPLLAPRAVEVVITTKTPTAAESGEVYTNTGDADGSTHTLLNDPAIGIFYSYVAMEAQTITINPGAGETIEANGSVCADVRIGAAVGESLTLMVAEGGAGGVWTPMASHGGFTCTP